MKANELRIGNYISLYNEFCAINGIDKKHPNDDEYYITINNSRNIGYWISQIKPIPLTEEWLLKFGFEYNDDERVYQKKDVRIELVEGEYIFNYFFGITYLKYVHQLQNLYFALTQEELKIK